MFRHGNASPARPTDVPSPTRYHRRILMRPTRPHAAPLLEQLESRLLYSAASSLDEQIPSPQSTAVTTAHPLLPDLTPWANKRRGYVYGWNLDRTEQPGHLLLRLTTAIANGGSGPLELRGGR